MTMPNAVLTRSVLSNKNMNVNELLKEGKFVLRLVEGAMFDSNLKRTKNAIIHLYPSLEFVVAT